MDNKDSIDLIRSLGAVPPELLAIAVDRLPEPEISGGSPQHLILKLPDGARARVTFVKTFASMNKRWYWTPYSAEILDNVRTEE